MRFETHRFFWFFMALLTPGKLQQLLEILTYLGVKVRVSLRSDFIFTVTIWIRNFINLENYAIMESYYLLFFWFADISKNAETCFF